MVRSAVLRFAAWSGGALLLLAVGASLLATKIARDAALEEARLRTRTIANTIAAPLIDRRMRAGDPEAVEQLDRVMRARMADGSLSHVKLWGQDGTVLWADEKVLVGKRFSLEEEVGELFGSTRVTAELSDLSKEENVGERSEGELLEVYAGTRDVDDEPFVFEAYLSTDRMHRYEGKFRQDILPVAIGGLLLFQLAILPLAVSLARRIERGETERTRMMRHSLLVTALEQRRIAQDLHDGVIQDLAGLRYAMPVVAAHLPDTPEAAEARDAVARVSSILQEDVAALRSLLTDIYPPDLHGPGFVQAVHDLAQQAHDRGVDVEVDIPDDFEESIEVNRLAFRVIREGLRNVARHARADFARVELNRSGAEVRIVVTDNGVGLTDPSTAAPGHYGLQLLEDTLTDFGGQLDLRSGADVGAVLEVRFPADLLAE